MGDLKPFNRRAWLLIVIVVLSLSVGALFSEASPFTQYTARSTYVVNSLNATFNISVHNQNALANISEVIIQLPSTWSFSVGSNHTNSTGGTSVIFYNVSNNLTWTDNSTNRTIGPSVTQFFGFNARLPNTSGTYTITIFTKVNEFNASNTYNIDNKSTVTITLIGVTSTTGEYAIGPEIIVFNWTNASLSMVTTINTTGLKISNATGATTIQPQYFTTSDYGTNAYDNLTSGNYDRCLANASSSNGLLSFNVFSNTTAISSTGFMNTEEASTANFTLFIDPICPPGLYIGNFTTHNITSTSEYVNLTAEVIIPISKDNTYNVANNSAFVRGTNSTTKGSHTYYFWTNETRNASSVRILLRGLSGANLSKDLDILVVNSSGDTVGKSIENNSEDLILMLPQWPRFNDLWEIRVGNTSASYQVDFFFAPVNITNGSNQTDWYPTLRYGVIMANNTGHSHNDTINITGIDENIITNLKESVSIYQVLGYPSINETSETYYVQVYNFTSEILVRTWWNRETGKGDSNYTIHLRNPNNTLVATSVNKWLIANSTDAEREEYIRWKGGINASNEGIWNITIFNASAPSPLGLGLSNRTTEVQLKYGSAFGITVVSNWTNGTALNGSTGAGHNASFNISHFLNLTGTNFVNGTYKGYAEYYNGSGWKVRVPLEFTVWAPQLLFVDSNTGRPTANTSVVRNKTAVNVGLNTTIILNFTMANNGTIPVAYNLTIGNGNQTAIKDSALNNISMVVTTNTSPIDGSTQKPLVVTIQASSINTSNSAGTYTGTIVFNTTSDNGLNQSHPYAVTNLVIDVNYTTFLNVTLTDFHTASSFMMTNASKTENLTVDVKVQLVNGTVISNTATAGYMNQTDFPNIYIVENNVTNYISHLTNVNLATGVVCASDICHINGTIPANLAGGNYSIYINVSYPIWKYNGTNVISGIDYATNLTGTGSNRNVSIAQLVINETGLNLSLNSTGSLSLGSISETTGIVYVNISVKNFGPVSTAVNGTGTNGIAGTKGVTNTNASINFAIGSCAVTVAAVTSHCYETGATAVVSGSQFSVVLPGYSPRGCDLVWKLTAQTVSSSTSCSDGAVQSLNKRAYANITGFAVTVSDNSSSTDDSGSTTGSGSSTSCTTDSDCSSSQYCSSNVCTALSCNSDEVAENHKCVKKHRLEIVFDPTEVTILGNGSDYGVTKAKISNKGGYDEDLNFSLFFSDTGIFGNMTYTNCTAGATIGYCTTTVTLWADITAPIGNRTVTLTAKNGNVTGTGNFTLIINPTEEKKLALKNEFSDLSAKANALQAILDNLRSQLTQEEIDELQALIDEIKTLVSQGQGALAAEKYDELQTVTTQIKEKLDAFNEKSGVEVGIPFVIDLWVWGIIILAVVIIVGVVVYALLPPRRRHPKFKMPSTGGGFTYPTSQKKGGFFSKFKKKKGETPVASTPVKREIQVVGGPQVKYAKQKDYHRASQQAYEWDPRKRDKKK
ncbi:MAG: hypothetical protein KKA90_00545 [Nanoarchaeota archaeon]|nr:hypothetical protein [Nanoarchaeota archaeon]